MPRTSAPPRARPGHGGPPPSEPGDGAASSRTASLGVEDEVCVALGDTVVGAGLALVAPVGGEEDVVVAGGTAAPDARPPIVCRAELLLRVAGGALVVARVGAGLAAWGQMVF
jgi:hypothetical protein